MQNPLLIALNRVIAPYFLQNHQLILKKRSKTPSFAKKNASFARVLLEL